MPTLRARSKTPSSSTPIKSHPTPSLPTSTSKLTRTPNPQSPVSQSHHHLTADELAVKEAAEILHLTTAELLAGTDGSQGDESPRSLRHKRLNDVRVASGLGVEDTGRGGSGVEGERSTNAVESHDRTDDPDKASSPGTQDQGEEEDDDLVVHKPPSPVEASNSESSSHSKADVESDTPSNSESDSDSESDSEDSETSEDDSEDDEEHLEKLLQAARLSAIAKATAVQGQEKAEKAEVIQNNDDELRFDGDEGVDESERKKEAPIPDMSIPTLPAPHLSFNSNGTAHASISAPQVGEAGPSRQRRVDEGRKVPELDTRPYERELSKKEKAAMPKKATTSELWATIPTPRDDLLPQMKRDYQALALANSLDPKRFMKGGNKAGKVPERFAIGTMVEAPRHLRDTTQATEKKYRPGQVVQNLVADDTIGTYAKRKYGDLQGTRMDNGRGKGWKKRSKW